MSSVALVQAVLAVVGGLRDVAVLVTANCRFQQLDDLSIVSFDITYGSISHEVMQFRLCLLVGPTFSARLIIKPSL